MADDYTILNPGVDGDVMDETRVTYLNSPTIRKRPRVVITGENLGEIVPALDDTPSGDEFGLVVRPIVSGYPGTLVQTFNSIDLVPDDSETTVVSYTVPSGKNFYFLGFSASGNSSAIYKFYVDLDLVLVGRTTTANLNLDKIYQQALIVVPAGSDVILRVLHYTSVNCEFEATIFGHLI